MHSHTVDRFNGFLVSRNYHGHRLCPPMKSCALVLRLFVFKEKGGHAPFVAPVKNFDALGSEPHRSAGCVDCRVSRTNDHHTPADRKLPARLVALNEFQSIDNKGMISTGNV